MRSATPFSPFPDDIAWTAARALAPQPPAALARVAGSGNNRVYRLTTAAGQDYALKCYPDRPEDPRDRLGTEFAALDFLSHRGVREVPRPVASDPGTRFALYEWIDGVPVVDPTMTDIDGILGFLERLHELRADEGAAALPLASEACLSATTIVQQIDARHARLAEIGHAEADLAQYLDEFASLFRSVVEWSRAGYVSKRLDFAAMIPPEARSLSPSDLGFHNALRRADGTLVFVDFEYFGWDDPAKLVADFMQHPGMTLGDDLLSRFHRGAARIFGGAETFAETFNARLALIYPLFGLRWCMILLNEFLPERWQARAVARGMADREAATRLQLEKARGRLAAVRQYWMEHGG